jgi:iron complex outermembrane receptor protein
MYTNEAVDATEGSAEFGIGSDNMYQFTGVFNTAISDDAFIRFAAYHQSQDSFIDNYIDGEKVGTLRDKSVTALRMNFTYEGWTDSQLKVSLNYEDRDQDGGVYRSVWNDGPVGSVSSDLGEEGKDVAEVFAATVDFTHDFDSVTFFSQTAIKQNTWNYLEDYDGTSMALGNYAQNDDNEYLSQEFRITSNTDSNIFWFVGVSGYQEKVKSQFYNGYNEDAFCAQLPNLEEWDQSMDSHTSQPENYYADCNEFFVDGWEIEGIEGEDYPAPGDANYEVRETINARGTNSGYGIYGDITWSMTEKTNLTFGGRFSYDKKEFALMLPDPGNWLGHYWLVGGHTDGQWLEDTQDWSQFTPRAAINHELTDDVNVYANYSRGYKAGGFNTFAFNLNFTEDCDEDCWVEEGYGGVIPEGSTLASYEPETVDSFEIGMKGAFLDDSLKMNIGAYYYDYQDFQGLFAANGGSIIKNIGQAEGKGIEFDVTYLPTDNVRLFLASAFQNSEVVEGEDLDGTSLAGQKLAAPEVTVSLVGSYFWYLDSDVDVSLQMSYNWQTETYGDEFMGGNDIYAQPSYGLLGANVTATGMVWSVSAYIDNITDEDYYDSGLNDTGVNHFGIGRGINGGVKVKYSF